jgi:integrase
MFNVAIDSKLRGCDVVALTVEDVAPNGYAIDRAMVRQKKTGRPVKFELTDQTRQAVDHYLRASGKRSGEFLFTSRRRTDNCMTTRQYARLVGEWIGGIGLDPRLFGTHSLRRHEPQEVGTKNASERQLRAAAKAALRKANKKHALTAMPRARPRVREAPSSAVLYLCNVLRIGVSGVGVTPTVEAIKPEAPVT